MNPWRVILVYTVLVSITLLLSLGATNDAYAVDIVLGGATCTTAPINGQTWDGSKCTRSAQPGGHVTIAAGDTLIIPNGITLEITANLDLRIVGGLTNNGDISITTNRDIRNDGVITNNGDITFTTGGNINNRGSSTFTNFGTIELDSTSGGTARIDNQNTASFTNMNTGQISLIGPSNDDAQIRNRNDATFTNFGTITIEGTSDDSGQLQNQINAMMTNSGTITLSGVADNSGRIWNRQTSSLINTGSIIIAGITEQSGWILNENTASLTNSGNIVLEGTNFNSGQIHNKNSANISNTGTLSIIGTPGNPTGLIINLSVITNSGTLTTNDDFNNNVGNSVIRNSGIIQITDILDNTNGLITNDCGEIIYGSILGNSIEEGEKICFFGTSNSYEDPTIGKSHSGKQVVEDGICIDIQCWTVTADYHQDFELVEMLTDSTHTISTTVFCQHGVIKCNYVAFGVSPYGTNINDSVWKIILQKDHRDNWTMTIIDPDEYLGEVTSTTQIVNDNRYLVASVTIEFKKPTPGMILNIEVRDSGGGYRDFKFNDGVEIVDAYAYPSVETSYEPPLKIKPLCLNENPNKRYTCAFDMIRDWTIKNAEAVLEKIIK